MSGAKKISRSTLRTDEELRSKILDDWKDTHNISRVAAANGVARRTVMRWVARWKEERNVADHVSPGRPRLTTGDMNHLLLTVAEEHFGYTLEELREFVKVHHGIDISARTYRRRLRDMKASCMHERRRTALTASDKKKRLAWAKAFRNKTRAFWHSVVYADETKSELQRNPRRGFARRGHQGFFEKKMFPPRYQYWGCMTSRKVGPLHLYRTNDTKALNRFEIKKIYETKLLPFADREFRNRTLWRLLSDNAPCHRATLVKNYLEEEGVQCVEFPPYSPDLNPIENLWSIIKSKVARQEWTTKEEHQALTEQAYKNVRGEILENLVDSMPRRIELLIARKGGRTGY